MINLEDLEVLKDKVIYNTNNDEYVLYQKNERSLSAVDYRLLGFLNGYCYSYEDHYLVKSTLDQIEISRIYLDDIEVGVFYEGLSYAYFYTENTIYQVTEDLDVKWSLTFDDDIRQAVMDAYGHVYILFMNSRVIRKYSNEGEYILYLNDSDTPSKYSRIYAMFISKGCGHLYVIGSDFWDNKVQSYVDHYNIRKAKLVERQILCEYNNVALDDEYFTYKDIYVDGDYIYIYANNYVERLNLKLRPIWQYNFGYNFLTRTSDCLARVVYDNEKYKNRIFFCENLQSSGGYSFGKLNTNGSLLWKITYPENMEDMDFHIGIYNSDIYMTSKRDITAKANYVLSLDDNRVLFETRDGNLIRIVEYNRDAIYDPENYVGRYLIGDRIKDGVPKFITYNLLHDTGEIITDDGYNIWLTEENKDYTNPDNYDYFRLVGTLVTDTLPDYSLIRTKDGKMIVTINQSYIETLYPYLPEMSFQYITNVDGATLNTDNDMDIIRSAGVYSNIFYILADRHKFFQHIITKKDEHTIITKKKEFAIVRKAKYVYRYVIKRLLDIDIIVEHLEENGILETMIPRYVDRLRHHTTHMIKDMQKALSPVQINLQAVKRYGYKYDGYDYPLRISNTQIFMCKNLPYIKKRYNKSIFIESMTTLIENEELTPFILFLNGKAVKWSDVTIVRDWYFSYIIISNNKDESDKLEAILFPCVIRYGEDNSVLPQCTTGLYFDENGLLTQNTGRIKMRVEVIDNDVVGRTHYITSSNPFIEFTNIEYNQLSDTNNIFAFENGYFFGDSRFYLDSHGKNIYTYGRDATNVTFKTFYFDKANHSKNMIFEIPDQEHTRDNIVDEAVHDSIVPTDNFLVPFDFKYTLDKSYLRNISEATRYILTYKMQLLIDFYRDQSNIKYYTLDGERVLTLASKNGGYMVMPRQKVDGLFDYVIVFLNDHLYEYQHEIEYQRNIMRIPIFDHVTFGDKVEIIHFKKVFNDYSTLTVTNNVTDYIQSELRYDDFLLFGNSYSGKGEYDDFDVTSNIQYEIDFDYKNNFNQYGKYTGTDIQLSDPYYYDKEITICSKRQFHSMYYRVRKDNSTSFDLEPEFRFCHNKNQYMVFVNHLRLTSDKWNLNVMTNDNQIEKMSISVTDPLMVDDMIHIFYIPESYEEIIIPNHSDNLGDIVMDVSNLEYPFDNELFLIFLDGRKVLVDDVQNISSNRVKIKNKIPLQGNICICKYLSPTEVLQKVFSYSDIWTKSVDSLSTIDYDSLFSRIKLK